MYQLRFRDGTYLNLIDFSKTHTPFETYGWRNSVIFGISGLHNAFYHFLENGTKTDVNGYVWENTSNGTYYSFKISTPNGKTVCSYQYTNVKLSPVNYNPDRQGYVVIGLNQGKLSVRQYETLYGNVAVDNANKENKSFPIMIANILTEGNREPQCNWILPNSFVNNFGRFTSFAHHGHITTLSWNDPAGTDSFKNAHPDMAHTDPTIGTDIPPEPGPTPEPDPSGGNDPFAPGGHNKPGGGGGTFTEQSDPVSFPNLPILSAEDSGFVTLYNPTIQQLFALNNAMWSDIFDINTWKRLFADPMDCLLGLSIVPVAVPHGEARELHVGNKNTGVSITRASTQFVELDCGSVAVEEYWGCYLDYSPYTKISIMLPYIGARDLDVDDCMAKEIHVKYHVDVLTGACVALVKCGESVLYEFAGQCGASIPLNGQNWASAIQGVLSIVGSVGAAVATGGLSAPISAGTAVAAGASAASTVISSKPTVERSGSIGGANGFLGIQKPYLIITRPNQALPKMQNTYMGYPSHMTAKLSELTGYTVVEEIHLQDVLATDAELEEIESLLKSGVVI